MTVKRKYPQSLPFTNLLFAGINNTSTGPIYTVDGSSLLDELAY